MLGKQVHTTDIPQTFTETHTDTPHTCTQTHTHHRHSQTFTETHTDTPHTYTQMHPHTPQTFTETHSSPSFSVCLCVCLFFIPSPPVRPTPGAVQGVAHKAFSHTCLIFAKLSGKLHLTIILFDITLMNDSIHMFISPYSVNYFFQVFGLHFPDVMIILLSI